MSRIFQFFYKAEQAIVLFYVHFLVFSKTKRVHTKNVDTNFDDGKISLNLDAVNHTNLA